MLETRATVVQTEGQYAFVKASQGNGCEQCNGKGCGSGKLSQLFCSKPRQFRVENSIAATVGDEVIVSVADGAVLRGIGLVYLLPLVLMVAGIVTGSIAAGQIEQRDGYTVAGAAIGLAGGFALSKWISSRKSQRQNLPFITRLYR